MSWMSERVWEARVGLLNVWDVGEGVGGQGWAAAAANKAAAPTSALKEWDRQNGLLDSPEERAAAGWWWWHGGDGSVVAALRMWHEAAATTTTTTAATTEEGTE